MEQPELKVYELPTAQLVPYANNAKIHDAEQVRQIERSIENFGFNDPIAVWTNSDGEPEIIEGHGRVMAAKNLGIESVPVVYLDHLTDAQRRAYTHIHNQLTMNSGFDYDVLGVDIDELPEFDWEMFGFERQKDTVISDGAKYTGVVKIPQYEPGELPVPLCELYDTEKRDALLREIDEAEIEDGVKRFLREAANRHVVFNYGSIADYYAQQTRVVQELMERSALVIIDINDAIANGYAKFSKVVEEC